MDLGYRDAAKALQPKESTKKGANKGQNSSSSASRGGGKQMAWQAQGSKQNWMSLVRFLEREELTPTVVFSFSKKVSLCVPHVGSSTTFLILNYSHLFLIRNAKR